MSVKIDGSRTYNIEYSKMTGGKKNPQTEDELLFDFGDIGEYETNGKSNMFLKEYLEGKLGGDLPEGASINVSSPKEYSEEFKQLLKSVRVDIYGARVKDMFKLITMDKSSAADRVQKMKITDEEKQKILKLKELFDNYYNVTLSYQNKTYDILNPDESTFNELNNISPDLAKFIKQENKDLKNNTIKFAQGELEHLELSDAGNDSKKVVPLLLSVFGNTRCKRSIIIIQGKEGGALQSGAVISRAKRNKQDENRLGKSVQRY